ncbi:hypothetical protein [Streptomyces marincola]|nr:hypothetical protein [Streptomyces marincola]UCM89719.1 hypothetical protein LC193_18145 [Streptomyces marincola]
MKELTELLELADAELKEAARSADLLSWRWTRPNASDLRLTSCAAV